MGVTSATGGNGKREGIVWFGGNRVVATIEILLEKKKKNAERFTRSIANHFVN